MPNAIEPYNEHDDRVVFLSKFFENWQISLEFAESKSDHFKKVLRIAESTPTFNRIIDICSGSSDNNDASRAFKLIFKAAEFLEFIKLYDIVKNWKSTVIRICGEIVDRKTIGKLRRCYTDKVKMINFPTYCYGVSPFTFNPFGCHRTKIHNMRYNAWYHYIIEKDGKILIDKKRILQEIIKNLQDYRLCPVLNPNEIFSNFLKLPCEIKHNDPQWIISRGDDGMLIIESREEVELRRILI